MWKFWFIGLMNIIAQSAFAQNETWSLEKCIKIGIENNLNLKLSEFQMASNVINLTESKFSMLPNVSASLSTGLSIGRNIDPTTNGFVTQNILFGNYGLNTSIVLFQGGQLRNTIKLNRLNLETSNKEYEQAINDLSLQIASNYLNVLLSAERMESAEKSLTTIKLQSKNMQRLVELGTRAQADALEIKAQELRSEQNLIVAENAFEQSKLLLNQVLRINKEINLEKFQEADFRNIQNESYNLDQLYPIAEKNQAFIQAAEMKVKTSLLQEKIAQSHYYPALSGFGNVNSRYSDAAIKPTGFGTRKETLSGKVNGTDINFEYDVPTVTGTKVISFADQFDQFLGYGFGLSARVPIYSNYSLKANVERTKVQSAQAKLNVDIQKEKLKRDVYQAILNVKAAIKEYEAAKKSLELSKLVSDNTSKKYDIGSANNFELNSAQNSFLSAENIYVISKYDLLFKQKILDLYAGKKIK